MPVIYYSKNGNGRVKREKYGLIYGRKIGASGSIEPSHFIFEKHNLVIEAKVIKMSSINVPHLPYYVSKVSLYSLTALVGKSVAPNVHLKCNIPTKSYDEKLE